MALTELPDIYFIRHGQTDWNAEGRYQGQQDIPLNKVGQAQADGNGRLLHDLIARDGFSPATSDWFASPMSRTRETMQRVRAAFDQQLPEVKLDERLVEISFGVFEGTLGVEHHASGMKMPGQRDAAFWQFTPEKGENYDMVAERVSAFLQDIQRPAVVVAHGGVARVFRFLIEGLGHEEAVNWPTPQDVILHFSRGRMSMKSSAYAAID